MKTLLLQSLGPPGRGAVGTTAPHTPAAEGHPGPASPSDRRREPAGSPRRASVWGAGACSRFPRGATPNSGEATKAPASRTHSKRFARHAASGNTRTARGLAYSKTWRSSPAAGPHRRLPVWPLLWMMGCWLLASFAQAQTPPTLMQEVISREVSIHVGGVQTPKDKELVSRECSVFVGDEPSPPFKQVISREVSMVVTTPEAPARVSPLIVTATPTGESVTLSWAGYNEWAQRDIVRYDIYMSTRPFTNISQMARFAMVPGETLSITLTNLPAWEDHFFAVVAVDALEGVDPVVNYAAAYVIAREVVSREFSVFVGAEPDPPYPQVVSREVSLVVTTPEVPAPVTQLTVTPTPTGESATLSWAGYNEWAQRDVVSYVIYMSTQAFTNISRMKPFRVVPAETFLLTLSNLTAWEDHFFAVVPVDALSGSNSAVNCAAGYVIAREVASREFSVFVGAEPDPPYRQVVSREVSIVVPDGTVPAPVTCLGCGFRVRDSVNSFSALDLDWTAYNEVGQKDVTSYHLYLGRTFYDDVSSLAPYCSVPAETKQWTLTSLDPYGIYYVAVVAVDVLGQSNPVVRAQSAQASVDRVREVRNLVAGCGTTALTFTWQPPEGADPVANTNDLLAGYRVYLADATTPVTLDRFAVSYTATNLLPGHGYPLRIQSVDISNRVSEGASLLAATLVPNPVQTVANSFYGITRVSWERVQPEEVIEGFEVYQALTNFTSVAGMTPVGTTRGHSLDFTNLVSGKTYYLAVTTRNIGGCESSGLPVRVVPVTPGTTAPTVLQAGAYAGGVFSIAVHGPVGADYVLLGSTNLSEWVRVSTNTPAALPFAVTVTNVPGANWFYRVKVE